MTPMLARRHFLTTTAIALAMPSLVKAQPVAGAGAAPPADTDWLHYAADLANTRYAPLDQINAENFGDLELAWSFKTDSLGPRREYQFEATPLCVNRRLYLTAGARRACVCLDAVTGELLWMHSIDEGQRARNSPRQLSGHGVSYWTDGRRERIFYVTIGYQLVCLDAATGDPDPRFGDDGIVDLKQGLDQDIDPLTADIGLHATPLVVGDVVVVGAAHTAGDAPAIRENVKGYVRGYDARNGRRKWIFHTIPRRGEFGYDTWLEGHAERAGNAGVWAQMSADEELGLVYLPVELPTGDEMGMFRHGDALFGECLVAVDARTGERRWHYQFVHHGLWDHDLPCAPILCDIPVNGRMVKALAQPTKQTFLFVLNRETGEPIWPIEERPVPAGDVPGEWYAPTQPFPTRPPPYGFQGVSPDRLIDFTPELHAEALELISHYVTGPIYTPPTLSKPEGPWGTLMSPGVQGGTNWPGGSYDPESHIVYVYGKNGVGLMGIVPNDNPEVSEFPYVHGVTGFAPRPQRAMGAEGEGGPPPGFRFPPPVPGEGPRPGRLFVRGLPLIKPPYGYIAAVDLTRGEIAWRVAHGETPDNVRNHPDLQGIEIPRTGREGNLGPLTTKSLVICGEAGFFTTPEGVRGAMLRAYDKATGEEKGAVYMPAPQSGSPMTYMAQGRQYIVVAIGGGNYSGELLAFRLPEDALSDDAAASN